MVEYFRKPVFLASFVCILFFYTGITIPSKNPYLGLAQLNDVVEICGTIESSPVKSSSGKNYYCNIKLNSAKTTAGVIFECSGSIPVFIQTDMVEAFFPGKLYSSSKNKGCFLYEAGGIYTFCGSFYGNGFLAKQCKGMKWKNGFAGIVSKARALCRLQFKRLLFAWGESGGLLLALLCGAREYTNADVSASFKNAGLSHILALSGMHLSMFSSIAMFFGDKVGRKKLTYLIRCIAIVIFVWFAGLSPSLLRAFICSMLLLLASVSSVEQPDMLLILCFSFLLQSLISSSHINNEGFLLSYGALCGIMIFQKMLMRFNSRIMPGYLAASLSASTGANILTAPISLKLFGSFSPIGIIATTFVSPVVTVFIYAGLALVVLCLVFPVLVAPSGIFMNILYTIIKNLVKIFAKVPAISL